MSQEFRSQFARARLSWVLILAIALIQSGCSTIQQPEPASTSLNAPFYWDTLSKQIEDLKSWKLIGKIGIRTPQDSVTAAINQWQQADSTFVIDLSSTFFGLGASKLYGTPDYLTIVEAGEEPISSNNPDLLIYQALGFPLPISYLSWWIKGIPVPDSPFTLEFNAQGQPATLIQNQWNLSFSKHKMINGLPLPGKVKLERDNVRIILAIKQWTLL